MFIIIWCFLKHLKILSKLSYTKISLAFLECSPCSKGSLILINHFIGPMTKIKKNNLCDWLTLKKKYWNNISLLIENSLYYNKDSKDRFTYFQPILPQYLTFQLYQNLWSNKFVCTNKVTDGHNTKRWNYFINSQNKGVNW